MFTTLNIHTYSFLELYNMVNDQVVKAKSRSIKN